MHTTGIVFRTTDLARWGPGKGTNQTASPNICASAVIAHT